MTSVLIATNEPVLAKGLESILVPAGFEITPNCADVTQVFAQLPRSLPGIAIIDTAILPTLDVVGELHKLFPRVQLVLWTRQITMSEIDEAVRQGARGVLPAGASPKEYLDALNMLAGFPAPDPAPATRVSGECSGPEQEAIALLGHGMSDQEIALAMRSDQNTVQKLLKSASRRLGAHNRCELALYGLSTISEAR